MKAATLVGFLVATTALATTPANLAGKVYREFTAPPGMKQSFERTIVFGADNRYTYLLSGNGSEYQFSAPYKVYLQQPRADGTYAYHRTSDISATVDLSGDDGSNETLTIPSDTGMRTISPGTTAQLTDGTTTTAALMNVSLRGRVAPGQSLIAGLIVPGTAEQGTGLVPAEGAMQREVLIRVIGPSLAKFGVAGGWSDPDFALFAGSSPAAVSEIHYADWTVPPFGGAGADSVATEQAWRKIFTVVGAFPLDTGSKDAVQVVRLSPGSYTIVCSAAAGDPGGEALIEVYLLP